MEDTFAKFSRVQAKPSLTPTLPPSITIRLPGALPSWNEILQLAGRGPFILYKFKRHLWARLTFALRAGGTGFWTKTINAKSSMLISCDTSESSAPMTRKRRRSRFFKRKSHEPSRKKPLSP